ncbi:alpha/beta fold hydrolase [Acidovorax sp. NPDC077693]|uniref:alpha/beta fold hydrolase n=1 Tax=unclassified Acidovorax TaxID=2684926 RepID=UPI0037C64221
MPTWIFLRGLTRESAHWGSFVADFERALPGHAVTALDLPGNGALHRQPSPTTVAGMVAACRAGLARRGVAPPYHLLAMSLGAMVATEWARVAPHEVAGCVLINTSFQPFSAFYQRLRPRNYAALLGLVLRPRSPEQMEHTVLRLTSRRVADHGAAVAEWARVRRARPVSPANALRQLAAAARYRAPVAAPLQRVLMLASQRDGLVDVRCSIAIAQAWQVPLRLHPGAGHDLPLDDGAWVVEQVRAWVADVGGDGSAPGSAQSSAEACTDTSGPG